MTYTDNRRIPEYGFITRTTVLCVAAPLFLVVLVASRFT